MKREEDIQRYNLLEERMDDFIEDHNITISDIDKSVLLRQFVDSERRVKYYQKISDKNNISESITDPCKNYFNPIKAIVFFKKNNQVDEAIWLSYLATYFGKSSKSGWGLLKNVYGMLNNEQLYFEYFLNNFNYVIEWIRLNHEFIYKGNQFSNHRKYETVDPEKQNSFDKALEDLVRILNDYDNSFLNYFQSHYKVNDEPGLKFDKLYKNLDLKRLGRLGLFDFLTMVGKLEVIKIFPPIGYLGQSTGPKNGAKEFFGDLTLSHLENLGNLLGEALFPDNNFRMQIVEDALCNWQKNKSRYIYFSG